MSTDWGGLNIAGFGGDWTRDRDGHGPQGGPPKRPVIQQPGHQMPYAMPHAPAMQPAGDWLHPMQRQGLNQYQQAMQGTNDAIEREMNSRVEQARDWDQMAHEQTLAGMKNQSEMAKIQGEMAMRQQEINARNQKNSALMRAAGLGGTTLVNGQPVDSFAPFRQSLLG